MNNYVKVARYVGVLLPIVKTFLDQERIEAARQIELAKRLRQTSLDLGPTFVKFSQMLSVRYDLFDIAFCHELQEILDHGHEVPYKLVRERIVQELGEEKINKYFRRIYPEPIAVASLGQVHKAELNNGQTVAIKVLHPGVEQKLKVELVTMKKLVRMASVLPLARRMRLIDLISEFEYWTLKEVDYTLEGFNIDHFSKLFLDTPNIVAPAVFWEVTTEKVLVTEYMEGFTIKEFIHHIGDDPHIEQVEYQGVVVSKQRCIDIMTEALMDQFYKHGFVHGDPHPSNLMITRNGGISFIDFGIVAKVPDRYREKFQALFVSLALGEYDKLVDRVLALDIEPGDEDRQRLDEKLGAMYDKLETSYTSEYSPTLFFLEVLSKGGKLGVQWPRFMILLGKVLATYDGIIQLIMPDTNVVELTKPYLEQMAFRSGLEKHTDPKNIYKHGTELLDQLSAVATELPEVALETLRDLKDEGIPVHIEHDHMDDELSPTEQTGVDTHMLAFLLVVMLGSFFAVQLLDPALSVFGIRLVDGLILVSGVLTGMLIFFSVRITKS